MFTSATVNSLIALGLGVVFCVGAVAGWYAREAHQWCKKHA